MKQKLGKNLFNSISVKILAVTLTALVLVAALSVLLTISQSNSFADGLIAGQIDRAFLNLKNDALKLEQECETGTQILSENVALNQAIQAQDKGRISEVLRDAADTSLDFVIATDEKGSILSSADTAEDAAAKTAEAVFVEKAMSAVEGTGLYSDGTSDIFVVSKFAVKGYNSEPAGYLIGVVSYNKTEMLDELKEIHGVDFTIFVHDVRMATTIIKDGKRMVGTTLDPTIADIVLNQKKEYEGSAPILGQPYKTAYSTILDRNGNAIGVLFAGLPMANIEQNRSSVVLNSSLIALTLIAIAVVTMLIYIRTGIRKPLLVITDGAAKLAAGNTDFAMNIARSDEIGTLADAFRHAAKSLQAMLADANMLAQAAVEGKLSTRADVEKHQGDYRKIVQGVNDTLDAVVGPVQEASSVLEAMAKGDLEVSVTGDYKGDHAIIKDALNDTINIVKGYIGEISQVLGEMAKGNLNVGITSEYRGDFIGLKDSINHIAASLSGVLADIGVAADQVAAGTSQVSDGSQAISQGATEQAASIEELTASVAQIAEQTKQNATSANRANGMSAEARDGALLGNEQMKALQQAMLDINESSSSISKIIKVIDDIAFQTNILALNAAVEAARAGVHGKGFAVVAEEVRNLAIKSADAAKETTALIESSVKKTEAGTLIANGTATALETIVERVGRTVNLVSEIAAASNHQATAISEVNRGIDQMSQVVQTNSATAEEAAAASEELSSQAELLKTMVDRFRLKREHTVEKGFVSKPITQKNVLKRPTEISLTDVEYGKY